MAFVDHDECLFLPRRPQTFTLLQMSELVRHGESAEESTAASSSSSTTQITDGNCVVTKEMTTIKTQITNIVSESSNSQVKTKEKREETKGGSASKKGGTSTSTVVKETSSSKAEKTVKKGAKERIDVCCEGPTQEHRRLVEDANCTKQWKLWGAYLSEREWATVREDYSENGDNWDYFSHAQSRSRAYRWGEDGIFGVCDDQCRLCMSLALWNKNDPILKERFFGLTPKEGNHGEDVKENYRHLHGMPTNSFMEGVYKYPIQEYPYTDLVDANESRSKHEREFEASDTGRFNNDACFDVFVELAKADDTDLLYRIRVVNRSSKAAPLCIVPYVWYRNTWSWNGGEAEKGSITAIDKCTVQCEHPSELGCYRWSVENTDAAEPVLLFTNNETNYQKLFNAPNVGKYSKDAFHEYIVNNRRDAVNPKGEGTKVGALYDLVVEPNNEVVICTRLRENGLPELDEPFGALYADVFAENKCQMDEFNKYLVNTKTPEPYKSVLRRAYAGLSWNKQFYHLSVSKWLEGDGMKPPETRRQGRNSNWADLTAEGVVSVPDKWEYPFLAPWDMAFIVIAYCRADPNYSKNQLLFMLDNLMQNDGRIAANEYNLDFVEPPVLPLAVTHVAKALGDDGKYFMAECFQNLQRNYLWWSKVDDSNGRSVFHGAFFGTDYLGILEDSSPTYRARIMSADTLSWFAFYTVKMMEMALELALTVDVKYEEAAVETLQRFAVIAKIFDDEELWNAADGFFYSQQVDSCLLRTPLKIRSAFNLVPLFAHININLEDLKRVKKFENELVMLSKTCTYLKGRLLQFTVGKANFVSLALCKGDQLVRLVGTMADETEFLSPYGMRSLSKFHETSPFAFHNGCFENRIYYQPGESDNYVFGGNVNWRGPIWMCLNYLAVISLESYAPLFADAKFVKQYGGKIGPKHLADDICTRVAKLFVPPENGTKFYEAEGWEPGCGVTEPELFFEYYDAESGRGCGASHEHGWSAIAVELLQRAMSRTAPK